MQFARRVHSNTTLKGGEGRMEIEYLIKKKELCASVPTIFVQDCRPIPPFLYDLRLCLLTTTTIYCKRPNKFFSKLAL